MIEVNSRYRDGFSWRKTHETSLEESVRAGWVAGRDTPSGECPQSFPSSGSFLMSQLFVSGVQSIGALVPASVLLINIQD